MMCKVCSLNNYEFPHIMYNTSCRDPQRAIVPHTGTLHDMIDFMNNRQAN